jgi:hypothetical protein
MDETIAQLRAGIKQLREDRAAIQPTAVPLDKAIGRAHAWIDTLRSMFGSDQLLRSFAAGKAPVEAYALANVSGNERMILSSIFWLDAKNAKKKVENELRELYLQEAFLTDDPGTRLSEIDSEVFRLEVLEERRICELATAGVQVARRVDANPEAVLAAAVG